MTRSLVLALAVALSSAFLFGCPDDKPTPDTKATVAASGASGAPAASAKPAAKGGW